MKKYKSLTKLRDTKYSIGTPSLQHRDDVVKWNETRSWISVRSTYPVV